MDIEMNTPIPETAMPGWEEIHAIPIHPTDEALVPLSLCPEKILVRSAYFQAGIPGTYPECYAREQVQERLMEAAGFLPKGFRFVILDAWRSTQVQTALFQQCHDYYKAKMPEADEAELSRLTSQFVALPSTSPEAPSPHLTGGAIDLLIADNQGRALFFGTPFDHAGDASHTRYFEEKNGLKEKEIMARDNRRLLYNAMTQAGFVNYHAEWWHFEFGTQQWALKSGKGTAFYGPAKLSLQSFT